MSLPQSIQKSSTSSLPSARAILNRFGLPDANPRIVNTGVTGSGSVYNKASGLPVIWSTKYVPIGYVALDWLTLTTFNEDAFNYCALIICSHVDQASVKFSSWLNYSGVSGDGFFIGMGQQNGVNHYTLRLSSSFADFFIRHMLQAGADALAVLQGFKCTRADVQYTYHKAPEYSLSFLADALRESTWPCHRAKRPKITNYQSDDGLDTVYIGSRSSPRMQRVYIKQVEDARYLRWEVEYKEQLAANLWRTILDAASLDVLPMLFLGEIGVVPIDGLDFFTEMEKSITATPERLLCRKADTDAVKSLGWLWSSVYPCLARLMSTDPRIKELAIRFLQTATDLEYAPKKPIPSISRELGNFFDWVDIAQAGYNSYSLKEYVSVFAS